MSAIPNHVRLLQPNATTAYPFSICTLVTRPDQYAAMLEWFERAGFGDDCEYLAIDNSVSNVFDAFTGYNAFLLEAQGRYVILVHQDVELAFDNRAALEARLDELSHIDPDWGVCGNAGGISLGRNAIRISDPHGRDIRMGPFPHRVGSLDENFLVVRRDANLCLSHDLGGYHMYGPDLCVMADVVGYRCYVVDFHLRHLSAGTIDASFWATASAFTAKYARAFRSRWIQTSVTEAFLTGSRWMRQLASIRLLRMAGITTRRN